MARLPFEPAPLASHDRPDSVDPAVPPAAATTGSLTVSQIGALIKTALTDGLPAKVRVVGEVSNFADRTHWFFSLKDEQATLRCVCFASWARKIRVPIADGMQVVATGRIDFYDTQGHVQLYAESMEPVGQGALELRLRQLIDELRGLGYFDPAHKKPLPLVPQRVAVVTSRSAAALQDVINTARRRWRGCRLLLLDVRVQGEAAAPEIVQAITALARDGPRCAIEAIILTRGGGSLEDLWAFNHRLVAEAIYRCPVPIVAAIGHETDTTIAELVADARCATPTQAAMTLIPDQRALAHQVRQLGARLSLLTRQEAYRARQRLAAAVRHPLFRRPRHLVELAGQRLDTTGRRLRAALPRRIEPARQRLRSVQENLRAALGHWMQQVGTRVHALDRQLEAVNPSNVLKRGYTYTLGPRGRVLRRVADARIGDELTTVLSDGRLRSRVESSSTGGTSLRQSTTPKRPESGADSDQPGLFS